MTNNRKYNILNHLFSYEDLPPDTKMGEVTELLKDKLVFVEEEDGDLVFYPTNKALMELGE